MIKLIVFDWDDVLTLGSKKGYFACYHATLKELGVHLDPEEEKKRILAKWSQSYREELRELLKENPSLLDKACEIYLEKLFGGTFINALKVLDGTVELLEELKEKYILCLATGVHPKILKEQIMPKFNIPNVFSQIITSTDVGDVKKQKPNPFMLEQIMKTQKAHPQETVYVGDAKSDVLMAKNAGVTPIVVLTGHLNQKEAEELGVKYIIKNVTHLQETLKQLQEISA